MKFYKNLYIGDTIRNPRKTRRKLKRHAKLQNVYVIAYMEESGQLSIYHNLMFQQRYYKEHPPYVIGIAGSHDEAVEIICRIAQESVRETGQADLTAYLLGRAMN
ncbi:MAG: hypothetical protein K2P66_05375 [Lachnospiraceae bacterium]|nr:hypothetical protein [Lachnospiraceae bacterium]